MHSSSLNTHRLLLLRSELSNELLEFALGQTKLLLQGALDISSFRACGLRRNGQKLRRRQAQRITQLDERVHKHPLRTLFNIRYRCSRVWWFESTAECGLRESLFSSRILDTSTEQLVELFRFCHGC